MKPILQKLLTEFPKTQKVEIHGEIKNIPELTEENFWTLIKSHNELIEKFNYAIHNLNAECEELRNKTK
jgi:hypothetical protein